ncbi:tRNA (N(6)-L-threonylcarbamoyladenosine(37)-C(2))-methylthiotransferase MtaB [Sphingomonas sanguinis]|jgi:threonylcarbamoyladenosine tRNA methylthiotransferase MtaB|uniref:tRNA (N(6)-L-threonylcarbamoyladenosine(37)-C(2))-methylthiotransferase n=1 Tax=Sphingomonas sanguinis TaxID=33051 RepID=A0A7Y7QS38_9SPHN|nr:tRNA (N(6)-L-threonylcarbamoyladenosine(37)-C(2))-methylthiotransferase MtaB [Sphingomonas sanguinis]MBZ6380163.1 tRNA (N(6)-L-threonylcarbamoyladenosine(37)-C(2))-methylthiotransferase MtaB [Sphingomonas sanguinis]NNG48792.1 tRNA (N(6)-L-threonylcarbamoyladenosine(37)-C(2))-methylthiotransferase MtaB [Sphingomonas sanguinis]NNG52039.1 tRNA (N(6)-L-threonylcarbamoyladenosine(37)-C(2))-methylthiotransferase MtaB [Sphingomonas sanguinis]NVP29464.1 tRNA (N(6)-L-threonylcarbamoyladenosine(37)-C(
MSSLPGPEIISLGCRLNIAESETIRALAADRADMVVINSCAVTNEAVKQTRAAIRRAAKARPDAQIVVTGCAAQIDPASFAAMPEVARVLGNADKLRPESWTSTEPMLVTDLSRIVETTPHLAAAFAGHARAFVEVQNGCDHSCTFCIIPTGRGPSRSVPAGLVIDRITRAVELGHREVVLTGVDLTSYGHDLPGAPSLGQLVERILTHVPALPRLRLSSLDSIEIDNRLFELVTGEARVMPHLHLSLQAGNDLILKRMKRRHSRAQSVAIVERLLAARPEIAIGADLIAGFPTEDDAMAADTLALIDDAHIVHAHIFPYSARDGTPAARMPQVPHPLRRERAAALRDAAARRRRDWLAAQVGQLRNVLVERPGTRGHAPDFADIHFTPTAEPGSIARVRVTAATETHLIGQLA